MHKPERQSHILLAGLGDLGEKLALALLAEGQHVSAIRRKNTAPAGIDLYAQDLVDAPALLLPPDPVDLVVICLTPVSHDEAGYRDAFLVAPRRLLLALHERQPLPPVIFVSSTAVFGKLDGEVNEETSPRPDTFNGHILLAAEEELSLFGLLTVVRLAGLYGSNNVQRQRAACFARGESELPGNHWMNRIHRQAAVALLHQLANCWLERSSAPPLVLGSDAKPLPSHVFYQQLAAEQGLSLSISGQPPTGKRLISRYRTAAGYVFPPD